MSIVFERIDAESTESLHAVAAKITHNFYYHSYELLVRDCEFVKWFFALKVETSSWFELENKSTTKPEHGQGMYYWNKNMIRSTENKQLRMVHSVPMGTVLLVEKAWISSDNFSFFVQDWKKLEDEDPAFQPYIQSLEWRSTPSGTHQLFEQLPEVLRARGTADRLREINIVKAMDYLDGEYSFYSSLTSIPMGIHANIAIFRDSVTEHIVIAAACDLNAG